MARRKDNRPVLAWHLSEDGWEGSAEIVFARNAAQARRNCTVMSDPEGCEIVRVPKYDCFLDDPEGLFWAQMADGWWIRCAGCETHIAESMIDDAEINPYGRYLSEISKNEPAPSFEDVVWRHGEAWCSEWCCGAHAVDRVNLRILRWEGIAWAVKRFPGCEVTGVQDCLTNNARAYERQVALKLLLPPGRDSFHVYSVDFERELTDGTMRLSLHSAAIWWHYQEWCLAHGHKPPCTIDVAAVNEEFRRYLDGMKVSEAHL